MAIRGAAIGGVVGFIFGRYLGAVLGAILGYRFENRILYRRAAGSRRPRPNAEFSEYYRIIGANPSDSRQTLKRKYREIAKANHPDIIRSSGATADQVEKATARMMKINEAWDAIKKERGI